MCHQFPVPGNNMLLPRSSPCLQQPLEAAGGSRADLIAQLHRAAADAADKLQEVFMYLQHHCAADAAAHHCICCDLY